MKDKIKVLIVDDDPEDYLIISKLLQKVTRTPFIISHAVDFDEITTILQHSSYDVILLDFYLKGKTAIDVLQKARDVDCTDPIIVITGLGQPEIDDSVMKLGAADYLPKEELSSTLLERTIRHAIERIKIKNELQRLVRQDGLTGLANRVSLEDILDRTISKAQRSGSRLAILFVDLDRFKEVNDALGHNVGDLLLKVVASRIERAVRKEDVVARVGGDEFIILLTDIKSEYESVVVAEKVINEIAKPTPISNMQLEPSASIGIALYPDAGDSNIELMQHADIALYRAKTMGEGCYVFFDDSLKKVLDRRISVEKKLRATLLDNSDDLQLYYQPQWNLCTGELTGAEALLRWNDPELGNVTPDEFIQVAEQSGLIIQLGGWVINQAMAQCRIWKDQGNYLRISINVSPLQLNLNSFIESFKDSLRIHGLDAADFELEVTEAIFINKRDQCVHSLVQANELGIAIAIDDFGTGYSSLSYLRQLPVTRLKIDRSFVSVPDSTSLSEAAISKSIIDLTKSLELEVIAEGIETIEQSEALINLGCHYGQGFYYGRPCDQSEFESRYFKELKKTHHG